MTKKVLVIDDDEKNLRILNLLIKSFGYSPVTVNDPRIGLDILESDPPALILLDLMMSPMNGLQFLDERRKLPGALNVPVVILSAWKLNDEELAPYADSIAGVVIKPVEPARLKEIIAQYSGLMGLCRSERTTGTSG